MTKNQGWKEPKNSINKKGKPVAGRHSDVQPCKCERTIAEPIEPETCEEIAKKELEKKLGVETKIISYSYYEKLGAFALKSISGEAKNSESEWIVFPDSETAEEAALFKVKEDLENEPYLFTPSWLENFITMYETDKRIIAGKEADEMVDSVYDEEEIVEKADLTSEIEEIDEKIASTDDLSELNKLDKKREGVIEKAREKLRNDEYSRIYDALENPIEYFVNDKGMYSREDLLKQSFIRIDIDKAAQDDVDTHGLAHFLDVYDGSGIESPSGAVAYGTN